MTTVLFYLVIASVIGLVVFFLAVLVFGRGEQMAPLDPRTSPAELPDHDIDSEDVRKIRFALALRGYRMSDVDWTLERLGNQIDELRLDNARLQQLVLPDGPTPADDGWVEPGEPVAGPSSRPEPEYAVPAAVTAASGAITGADIGQERAADPGRQVQEPWLTPDRSPQEHSATPHQGAPGQLSTRVAPAVDR